MAVAYHMPGVVKVHVAGRNREVLPSIPPQSVYIAAGFQDIGFTKQKDVKIVIITYSLIQNRSAVAHTLQERQHFRCVIVDESHNLKQRDSQRTKLLLPILQRADRLLLLSGTPALARPCELWTQLTCLAPKVFGTWTAFANRYCNPHRKNIGGRYLMDYTGSSNQLELHSKLKNVMVRRLKTNVLSELPPKQRSIVPVPISSDHKATCAHAMADLKETRESVANLFGREAQQADFEAKGKLMAAFQASGIGKAKSVAEYLLDWLSGSAHQKILVFAHHKTVLDTIDQALMEKHPNSHIRIDGSVPTVIRAQLVKKFQTCERVRVGLLSMTAAGVGLTLTAASTVLFAELHWTPGVLAQCEDRAHRIGQSATSVQILYAVCKDGKYSVDMAIWRMLGRKIGAIDAIVDGKEVSGIDSGSRFPFLQVSYKRSDHRMLPTSRTRKKKVNMCL
jgi:SWI/SNF-related matrix-associated actin-dependent regulator of chromatin subfamily A-like protein 1